MNERERIVRMLRRERGDLLPWATRLDIWHIRPLATLWLRARLGDILSQSHPDGECCRVE